MNKFYTIKDKGEALEIRLYGDIAMDEFGKWTKEDACPSDIIEALKGQDKPLTLRINSGGGSVFGGIAIYNAIKNYRGKKTVYVDGIAASIASVIMLAGDEINIPKNATVMLHEPVTFAFGTARELGCMVDALNVCWDVILSVYGDHLKEGQTLEDLKKSIEDKGEWWMDGQAAADIFNLTATQEVAAAACTGRMLDRWQNTPEGIPRARAEPEEEPPKEPEIQENQEDSPEDDALELIGAFCFAENVLLAQSERNEWDE